MKQKKTQNISEDTLKRFNDLLQTEMQTQVTEQEKLHKFAKIVWEMKLDYEKQIKEKKDLLEMKKENERKMCFEEIMSDNNIDKEIISGIRGPRIKKLNEKIKKYNSLVKKKEKQVESSWKTLNEKNSEEISVIKELKILNEKIKSIKDQNTDLKERQRDLEKKIMIVKKRNDEKTEVLESIEREGAVNEKTAEHAQNELKEIVKTKDKAIVTLTMKLMELTQELEQKKSVFEVMRIGKGEKLNEESEKKKRY